MRYATFKRFDDNQAVHIDETWDEFTARLSKFIVTDNKKSVGLFSATYFGGTGRRLKTNAEAVSFLVLDFDNSEPLRDENGEPIKDADDKIIKVRIARPVGIMDVESTISTYDYVLVTSHSHSADWPRFRLVVPIESPVPAGSWTPYAEAMLAKMGLDEFLRALDSVYKTANQIYYWPSHAHGSTLAYYKRNKGAILPAYVPGMTAAPSTVSHGTGGKKRSDFTPEQVQRYFENTMAFDSMTGDGLDFSQPGDELKARCPIHNGKNLKFCVNRVTGFYKCFSKCRELHGEKEAGGDIYRFHEMKFGVDFKTAKKAVHTIIGGEPGGKYTTDELAAIIDVADESTARSIFKEIAKQPTKERNALVKQLITTHPQLEAAAKSAIQTERKVISFTQRDGDASAAQRVREEAQAKLASGEADIFGLCVDPLRYEIDMSGVHQMRLIGPNSVLERLSPPLADRPIWPAALGNDLATEKVWMKLAWFGSNGSLHEEWHPSNIINSREGLLQLDDAPVSLGTVVGLSTYLAYAKTAVVSPFLSITSAVGWCGGAENRRFVLPGDPTYAYIGPKFEMGGSLEAWAEGIPGILSMGTEGYIALAVLGLSAASPFVRLLGKRNPVMGLVFDSSKGKSVTIQYGLSMWGEARSMTIAAGSTIKGIQDGSLSRPDFPVFVDELQQMGKRDTQVVEDLFYYMGNGQRRQTSSRNQTARGGERRYGVSFYAAEDPIATGLQQGAQNRVIELTGQPLRDAALGDLLQRCTTHNGGAAGLAICELLNRDAICHIAEIEMFVAEIHEKYSNLKGDDAYVVAMIRQGLRVLSEVTKMSLPEDEIAAWLITHLGGHRASARDHAEDGFIYLLETLLSMEWTNGSNQANSLSDHDGFIAWRRGEACDPTGAPLEINPTHRKVIETLKLKGQTENIARSWANRGWIRPQNRNLKWSRPLSKSGAGARAWRITLSGLELLRLNADFASMEEQTSDD